MNVSFRFLCLFLIFLFSVLQTSFVYALIPNDPYFDQQWYLEAIRAPQAWELSFGTHSVVVAVIDVGIDIAHPDLSIWNNSDEIQGDGIDNDNNGFIDDFNGWNFAGSNNDVTPKLENLTSEQRQIVHHGTAIAGIIGAIPNNREGIAGVNWKAEIMPIKIAEANGLTNTGIMTKAIMYAVDNGAQVINISLTSVDGVFDKSFRDSVEYAYSKNVLVVAAVGNNKQRVAPAGFEQGVQAVYPACFVSDNQKKIVLGVGALDRSGQKASFSNYGKHCVELSAPGVDIFSTKFYRQNTEGFDQSYGGFWFGTSFSAPLVAGAASIVKSIKPDITTDKLIELLRNTGELIDGDIDASFGVSLNLQRLVAKTLELAGLPIVDNSGAQNATPVAPVIDNTATTQTPVQPPTSSDPKPPVIDVVVRPKSHVYYTAPMSKGEPIVRVYNDSFEESIRFFAYNKWEAESLQVIALPVALSGLPHLVTAPGKGAAPLVRIYTHGGILVKEFYAYAPSFKGGVHLAVGDIDGDGRIEIITVPLSGGGPHVRIFDEEGRLKGQFFAHDRSYRGSLSLAVGDIDGDKSSEIVIGLGEKSQPFVKIFKSNGVLINEFKAYADTFRGGVSVAVADVNADDKLDIITGARFGGGPHIRVFTSTGAVQSQFFAYEKSYRGGVRLGAVDFDRLRGAEIVVYSEQEKSILNPRVYNGGGELVKDLAIGAGSWISIR